MGESELRCLRNKLKHHHFVGKALLFMQRIAVASFDISLLFPHRIDSLCSQNSSASILKDPILLHVKTEHHGGIRYNSNLHWK